MVKISFLGDIMCEEPFLKAAIGGKGFEPAFEGIRQICSASDYVIGNLETPFAGKKSLYTHEMYSFNTPDSFVSAVQKMGVSMVLTANNHCCDRGMNGLLRTLKLLDQYKLPHTGTYTDEKDSVFFETVGDIKIAVISCTASTNSYRSQCSISNANVNLLQEQKVLRPMSSMKNLANSVKRFVKINIVGEKNLIRLRTLVGLKPKSISVDNWFEKAAVEPYIKRLEKLIKQAKNEADVVFVCPHMGGQFNVRPGKFSEYVMERLAGSGADAVVASHPHIIQKAEYKREIPCFFSLGNVSMSMSTAYILRNDLPDYGMMVHFYLRERKIERVTFSLILFSEDKTGYPTIKPLRDAYIAADKTAQVQILKNAECILRRILQDDSFICEEIQEEYMLKGEKNCHDE